MKIGIFTDAYLPLPNGVSTAVDRTARALEKKGHTVTIIAPNVPGHKDNKKNIYRLPSISFLATGTRFALHIPNKTLLDIVRLDFDVIHAYNGGPISLLGWEIAKTKDIPYVFTYCTLLVQYTHYLGKWLGNPRFMKILSKIICNYCDYLIVPTGSVKIELLSYGVTKKMHIDPTGIELDEYKDHTKGFIREKIGVGKNKKIVLHVGRLGQEKAIDFLISAFWQLQKRTPQAVLVLVGSGAQEQTLRNQVEALGLSDSVFFLGAFPPETLPQIYADADIFVFASQTETQGLVILEALASSLPIVAVKDAVFHEILDHGKNSYMVKKDAKLFAESVFTLLNDKKLHAMFAKNSLETAKKFSIQQTADNLEKVYEELIKEASSKPPGYRKKYLNKFHHLMKPFFLVRK